MALYTIFLKRHETSISESYDDEENPVYSQHSKTTLEQIQTDDLSDVFNKYEDGDGDETGSFSVFIKFICDESGRVIFSHDAFKIPTFTDVWGVYYDYTKADGSKRDELSHKVIEQLKTITKARGEAFERYKKDFLQRYGNAQSDDEDEGFY